MPIEIRELVIKATVVQDTTQGTGQSSQTSSNNAVTPQEEMVNLCISKITEIQKEKNER